MKTTARTCGGKHRRGHTLAKFAIGSGLLFLSAHTLYNRFCAKRDQAVRSCFDTLQMESDAEYDE